VVWNGLFTLVPRQHGHNHFLNVTTASQTAESVSLQRLLQSYYPVGSVGREGAEPRAHWAAAAVPVAQRSVMPPAVPVGSDLPLPWREPHRRTRSGQGR